jgi:hypothetical protein
MIADLATKRGNVITLINDPATPGPVRVAAIARRQAITERLARLIVLQNSINAHIPPVWQQLRANDLAPFNIDALSNL